MIKKILLLLLAILVIIQFFPISTGHATATNEVNDISTRYNVPNDVKEILKTACNDCHSNTTVYPWYSRIQPVGWWLKRHTDEGRRHLNFNEFTSYKAFKQFHKLEETEEQVKKEEMPLFSYTIIHRKAILSAREKQSLILWTKAVRQRIKTIYPPDSLKKSKSLN